MSRDISGLNKDQKMIALVFFPKLRGINFGDISLKIKGNSPQEFMTSDINGKWFFMSSNMTILFKAFSEEKFDQSLQELLKKNNIKLEDEIQEKEIRVWNGDGFKIENPPMINNVHIIIITNENFVHVDAMSLKETDLTSEISLPQEYRYIGIKHVYDGNKTLKKSKDIIKELTNVALLFKDDDSDFILIANASLPPSKQIIDSIVEKNGGKNNFKFNDKIDDTWEHVYQGKQFVIGYLKQHSTIRINFLKFTNEIEEFENNLRSLSPPIGTADFWIDILNKRGESRKMFKKSFNQTFHDSAQGHCQEYILKYENDQMTIEDIYNRIDVYHLFIEQYDILFSKYQELNKSIPEEIENKFFALLESLAGAELTLLKIQKNYDHDIDEERIFKDVKRSNNGIVEDDEKESNKDLVDKDIFTYYKGYLFNGILVVHYEDEKREMSMRFGLKHGSYTRYDKKGKIIESKQAWNDAV